MPEGTPALTPMLRVVDRSQGYRCWMAPRVLQRAPELGWASLCPPGCGGVWGPRCHTQFESGAEVLNPGCT